MQTEIWKTNCLAVVKLVYDSILKGVQQCKKQLLKQLVKFGLT